MAGLNLNSENYYQFLKERSSGYGYCKMDYMSRMKPEPNKDILDKSEFDKMTDNRWDSYNWEKVVSKKMCYVNAHHVLEVLLGYSPYEITYVEGTVFMGDFPMPLSHAWLRIYINEKEYKILDPTFALLTMTGSQEFKTYKYIPAMELNYFDLEDYLIKTRHYGPFYEDILLGYYHSLPNADKWRFEKAYNLLFSSRYNRFRI